MDARSKSLNEHIARKANAETKCTGRFWDGRYKSKLVTTKDANLIMQIYIDLIPIFDRLDVDRNHWIDSLKNYDKWFYRIVGKVAEAWEILKHTTSKWFKGTKANENLFGP